MSKRAVDELMNLKSSNLGNDEDLCNKAGIEVEGGSFEGVTDDIITMEVTHQKFSTDLQPLVVGVSYQGKHVRAVMISQFCYFSFNTSER